MNRECRSTLMLGVLSVIADDLVRRHHADTDPAGDALVADILAAVALVLATPGEWGELVLITHVDDLGHVAGWGESITEIDAVGACHWAWLQPVIDDVYASGWFTGVTS